MNSKAPKFHLRELPVFFHKTCTQKQMLWTWRGKFISRTLVTKHAESLAGQRISRSFETKHAGTLAGHQKASRPLRSYGSKRSSSFKLTFLPECLWEAMWSPRVPEKCRSRAPWDQLSVQPMKFGANYTVLIDLCVPLALSRKTGTFITNHSVQAD